MLSSRWSSLLLVAASGRGSLSADGSFLKNEHQLVSISIWKMVAQIQFLCWVYSIKITNVWLTKKFCLCHTHLQNRINTSTHLKVCYLFSLNNYRHTQQSTSVIQTRMVIDVNVSVYLFSPICCAFVKWMSEIYSMEMNGVSLGGIKRNEVWVTVAKLVPLFLMTVR